VDHGEEAATVLTPTPLLHCLNDTTAADPRRAVEWTTRAAPLAVRRRVEESARATRRICHSSCHFSSGMYSCSTATSHRPAHTHRRRRHPAPRRSPRRPPLASWGCARRSRSLPPSRAAASDPASSSSHRARGVCGWGRWGGDSRRPRDGWCRWRRCGCVLTCLSACLLATS